MPSSTTDRFLHILEEIEFLTEHTAGLSIDDIWADEVLKRAVIRSIEVIGEAANRLPAEVWRKYPHVEWRDLVDQRNRLIHGYDTIDRNKVWDKVTKVPVLQRNVEQIIENERQR